MNKAEDVHLNELSEDQGAEPGIEYKRRREARLAAAARQIQRFRKVGILRLALLAAVLVMGWLALKGLASWWWVLLPRRPFSFG